VLQRVSGVFGIPSFLDFFLPPFFTRLARCRASESHRAPLGLTSRGGHWMRMFYLVLHASDYSRGRAPFIFIRSTPCAFALVFGRLYFLVFYSRRLYP
jgi:hypothetical protein